MPAARIVIHLPGRPDCTARIGARLLPAVGEDIARVCPSAARAVLLADQQAASLYRAAVKESLVQVGLRVLDITVPSGPAACTVDCASELWSAFAQSNVPAQTILVAMGGVSTCTVGLYAAAGYCGGMPCALIPTTSAAMALAATLPAAAVDLPQAPAAATALPQPSFACLSLDVLADESRADAQDGYAELVRAALMGANDEFFQLADRAEDLAEGRDEALTACFALANIARADALAAVSPVPPRLTDHLGFAFGSSLPRAAAACGFDDPSLIGRLLADGMRFESRLGAALGITPLPLVSALDAVLVQLGLDSVPHLPEPAKLVDALSELPGQPEGALAFAVPQDAGRFAMETIDPSLVMEHLAARAVSLDSADC